MRARSFPVLLAILAFTWAASAAGAPKPLRVLFIGNSLTYYNALPSLVAGISAAATPNVAIEADMLAAPGATIRENIDHGHLAQLLSGTRFDVVVFQEFGGFPLCDTARRPCAESPPALEELVRLIRKSGARPILLGTYQAVAGQAELTEMTNVAAKSLDVTHIDWGAALQRTGARDPSIELFVPKDFHPRPAGSWLAALLLARSITRGELSSHAPARVCAPDWTHAKPSISNSTLASRQLQPAPNCFEIADSTYQVLRAAALED